MTRAQAVEYVREHSDDDDLDADDLSDAFYAFFRRNPDVDESTCVWSHLCACVDADDSEA